MGYYDPSSVADPVTTPETAYPLSAKSISGYRFLAPELGRWVSRDPIGEEGGVNIYVVTANDYINSCDAIGELTRRGPFEDTSGAYTSTDNPGRTRYIGSGPWGYSISLRLFRLCYVKRVELKYVATIYVSSDAWRDPVRKNRVTVHEDKHVSSYDGIEMAAAENAVNTAPTGFMCCDCAEAHVAAVHAAVSAYVEYAVFRGFEWDAIDLTGADKADAEQRRDAHRNTARSLLIAARDAYDNVRRVCGY